MTISLTEAERQALARVNWFEDTDGIAPTVEAIIAARLAVFDDAICDALMAEKIGIYDGRRADEHLIRLHKSLEPSSPNTCPPCAQERHDLCTRALAPCDCDHEGAEQ